MRSWLSCMDSQEGVRTDRMMALVYYLPVSRPEILQWGCQMHYFLDPGCFSCSSVLEATFDEWLPHQESVLGHSNCWWIAFTSCHLMWSLLSRSMRGHLHDLFVMRLQFLWCQQSPCGFDVIAAIVDVDADWGQKGLADCGVEETTDYFWLGDFWMLCFNRGLGLAANCACHPDPCSLSLMFKPSFISLMMRHLSLLFQLFMRVVADQGWRLNGGNAESKKLHYCHRDEQPRGCAQTRQENQRQAYCDSAGTGCGL